MLKGQTFVPTRQSTADAVNALIARLEAIDKEVTELRDELKKMIEQGEY